MNNKRGCHPLVPPSDKESIVKSHSHHEDIARDLLSLLGNRRLHDGDGESCNIRSALVISSRETKHQGGNYYTTSRMFSYFFRFGL
jgi:hypothetical protein